MTTPLDIRYYKHALIVNQSPNDAFVSISTLWTPKTNVESLISDENMKKVLVIGQWYTYEGIKFIQYNICANPNFQTMIVTGFDNNKIIPRIKNHERGTLEDIFWKYWGEGNNSDVKIPDDVVAEKHGNIIFLKDFKQINQLLTSLTYRKPWLESPIIIPPPIKTTLETFDSEKTGFVVRDSSLYRLWHQGLMRIKKFGTTVDGTREVMNLMSVLTSEPKLHKDFPASDQCEQYLPQVCDEKPTKGLVYTYGSRLHQFNQIDEIIKSLSDGIFNRNGVSTTWQPQPELGDDYHHPPPCLVLATFRIHPLKTTHGNDITTNVEFKKHMNEHFETPNTDFTHVLYINTVFRSHDYYKGMPMNLWALWYLGQKVIDKIQFNVKNVVRIKHGELTNLSIAAHVYEQDFKNLDKITANYMNLDPRGYFTISLLRDEKKLRVALMSKENKEMEVWESDDPRKICNEIQIYISDVSHAMYMGRELMKAKQCLIDGTEYKQD